MFSCCQVWVMRFNLMSLFMSTTGTQTVRMGKIELNSVVPNSQPETFINIRGQSLTWCECGVTLSGV